MGAHARRDGRVAAVAHTLRCLAGEVDPPFNAYAILEASWPTAVITGRDLPNGVDEVLAVTEDGPLIIYDRSLSTADRRIAIGHAIAHLALDDDHAPGGIVQEPEREERAEQFARELLVPPQLLLPHVSVWPADGSDPHLYLDQVDRLAAAFHVPPSVIDEQIRELEQLGLDP